jgi:hypothetical protein
MDLPHHHHRPARRFDRLCLRPRRTVRSGRPPPRRVPTRRNGGAVVLTASDGVTTIDTVSYPELDADLAYGRTWMAIGPSSIPRPAAVNAAPIILGGSRNSSGATRAASTKPASPSPSPIPTPIRLCSTRSTDRSRPCPTPAASPSPAPPWSASRRTDRVTTGPDPDQDLSLPRRRHHFSGHEPAITQDPAYAPRMRPGLLALPTVSICLPGEPEYEEKEGSLEILWPGAAIRCRSTAASRASATPGPNTTNGASA